MTSEILRRLLVAGAAISALAVGGCASLTGAQSQIPSQILDNLAGCSRTYTAAIGGLLPPAGSLHIQCEPTKPPAPE
ncbi:hypothetical protein [Phenylobacterium sp.]|uniref:hypothetical protein n=1 Tax=Phenylobacterium sp. TaxID=1871053 RepID=UPI002FC68368